jgi:rare lipoprotein A (peptidoglycan hydrolase)
MTRIRDIRQLSKEVAEASAQVVLDLPRTIISEEEVFRRRIQAFVRVALATSFLWLTAIISLGATVTTAVAKTVGKDKSVKERRIHLRRSHKLPEKKSLVLEGTASWYGHQFHKRKTASGKTFDKNRMMAAHRTLPFGTLVRVTNTENDRSCIVEIADRGPFVHQRIIDLSEAAAKVLDFKSKGTAHVTIQVISPNLASRILPFHPLVVFSDALRMPSFAGR